ncbi:MAG: DUF389 domain-containing protein, partial [Desulfobacteraceae bacterium]|nr:DUF389 domain-containing protein [Desulfobacteraceae bacterium]
ALIRSDARLLGRAARAEIAGVFAAILMGLIIGKLYPALEPTPEMLSRTQPQLFDLLVAVFSGFAGAYALVDEKISPALPGVAIATAIVPPLANTGLCFAVGAYAGGVGSFLLFFSNFLSILLVASVVFGFFGMAGRYHELSRQVIIKRFALPITGFLLIALDLSHTLYQISKDRHIKSTIENVLIEELADLPSVSFDKMIHEVDDDEIQILAHAHTATVIPPTQVSKIQKRLSEELKQHTELIIRSNIAHTVAALDSMDQIKNIDLDGDFIQTDPHPRVLKTKKADSAIRNYLSDKPTAELIYVRLIQRKDYSIILATMGGVIRPDDETITQMETLLHDKLKDPKLHLIVQFINLDLFDREGRLRFELTGFSDLTPEQEVIVDKAKTVFKNRFESDSDFSLAGIDYTFINNSYYFFLEIAGSRVFPKDGVEVLERLIAEKIGQPVQLCVLSSIETVATSKGYESYRALSRRVFKMLEPKLKKDMEEIVTYTNL